MNTASSAQVEPPRRLLEGFRGFCADYALLVERQQLRNRPWAEDFLHVARDGRVHGHLLPTDDRRLHGITADGWCPCWSRERPLASSRAAAPGNDDPPRLDGS